jgi:hypothetical protein
MSDYITEHGINSTEVLEYMLHQPNSQRAIDEAKKLGMDVVFPESNQLQLDIDNDADYAYMQSVWDVLDAHWGIVDVEEHPSKSGLPKRHVTITLNKELAPVERVLLQACFGSDRKRELLSYLQVLNGDAHPILFLELRKQQLALPPAPEPLLISSGRMGDVNASDILTDADCPF